MDVDFLAKTGFSKKTRHSTFLWMSNMYQALRWLFYTHYLKQFSEVTFLQMKKLSFTAVKMTSELHTTLQTNQKMLS